MLNNILAILAAIVPFVIELIKKERDESQTPMGYVKAKQEEQLKVYENLLSGDTEKLSRLKAAQLALATELLRRVRDARSKPAQ